jgi:hypothetical protein
MIESPVIQEILAEREQDTKRKDIVSVLRARFGDTVQAVRSELDSVEGTKLDEMLKRAATCRSLASFRKKLTP